MARKTTQPVDEMKAEIEHGLPQQDKDQRSTKTDKQARTLEIKLAKSTETATGLRERLDDERARADRLEQRAADLAERLIEAQAEHHRIPPLQREIDLLRHDHERLEQRVQSLVAERDAALDSAAAALARADEMKDTLAESEARLEDARREHARTESENHTLAALSRQQAKELVLVRQRIADLLSSRWRRLGQKIGVTMVMPWEQEMGRRG